ncbi:hypothetical protein T4D_16284, partial [Trichinella pseudospiralis]
LPYSTSYIFLAIFHVLNFLAIFHVLLRTFLNFPPFSVFLAIFHVLNFLAIFQVL